MTVLRSCPITLLGFLLASLAVEMAAAAEALEPRGDAFANGMHAYFGGSSADAESLFVQAIRNNPNDPRAHYFLGLCLLQQGHSDEARAEMTIGAAVEARSPGSYAVGKALERVQGEDRLLLEGCRRQARADRVRERSELKRTLYRPNATYADHRVLRQKVPVPLDKLVQPASLAQWSEMAIETRPAVTTAPATPAPAAAAVPAAPAPVAATDGAEPTSADPFADDPAPQSAGKIPSGKLLGIVGRALLESAPLPSLEGVREQLPELPMPAAGDAATEAEDDFGFESEFAPADGDDPFAEPRAFPGEAESSDESAEEPTDATAEDPFDF